jgi:hypothetical protein
MTILWAVTRVVSSPLTRMMQAALTRSVAFTLFSQNPRAFETHPANASLTWAALKALEGECVVQVVECFRNKLYKPHLPDPLGEKVERLLGHRNVVSHPFNLKEQDWSDPKMQQFEAAGRRFEPPLPFMLDIYQTLNAELEKEGSERMGEFHVTPEMACLLRQIWVASMKSLNIATIPNEAQLLELLRGCLDKMLVQCEARASGSEAPERPETLLDRMWAAVLRGDDPDSVV